MRRPLILVDAPSNLGLRPPADGAVPGCYKLAGALREQRLLTRLGAEEGGVVVPPRYDRAGWKPGDGVFNAAAIAAYTRRLADRVEAHVRAGAFPLVLGGDCSIQLGASLALRRIGRYGIAVIDGSADFRHPGNSEYVGAAGGEELALATGRGQTDLTDIEGLRPYLRESDVQVFGIRDYDTERAELTASGIASTTVGEIRKDGAEESAAVALRTLEAPELEGFWVHLDADVLDPSVMPAVDSPDDGGLLPGELTSLLRPLVRSPRCVGLNLTIYDPDLDPDGTCAALLAEVLVTALVRP
jgi:arginase